MGLDTTASISEQLHREATGLLAAVTAWPASRWAEPAGRGLSRGDAAYRLVVELARLGADAGSGVPVGAVPPRLADTALPSQLAVLVADLLASPDLSVVAPSALEAVMATRLALHGAPRQR